MDTVEQQIHTIIADTLKISVSNVYADSVFTEDLGADSLDMVEIVLSVEERFDIDLDDSEPDTARTVGQLVEHVRFLLSELPTKQTELS